MAKRADRAAARSVADHRLLSVAVSVEASWSGQQMTLPARRLMALLAVLPDGIARVDIDVLFPGVGTAAANVLRRRALVFDEAGRLRTYPPVRYHVSATHAPAKEDLVRATIHFIELTTRLSVSVGRPGGAEASVRLAAELANISKLLIDALHGPVPSPAAIGAAIRLAEAAEFSGLAVEEVLAAAGAAVGDSDMERQARVQQRIGDIALARSDYDAARAAYERVLPLHQQIGNVLGEANCIQRLGDIAFRRSDHDAARAAYEKALLLYQQDGDALREADCIHGLGNIACAFRPRCRSGRVRKVPIP